MKTLSRRQFLHSFIAGLGAAAISACEKKNPTQSFTASVSSTETRSQLQANSGETPQPISSSLPSATISPEVDTQPVQVASQTPSVSQPTLIPNDEIPSEKIVPMGNPDLVVAHGGDDPETIVRRAIMALGGMEQFVTRGAKVVIKPNICTAYHSYEYASTTNPWVVAALVKMCLEAGADNVSVMDYPFGGTAEQAYLISGIQEQVEAAGGKMVVMSNLKFTDTQIPDGQKIKKWPVYEDVLKADVLINVPIAKDHGLTKLTLGMKNLMGVVKNRERLHSGIGQRLADLSSLVRPTLTVVDSIRILLSGGPTGGDLNAVKKLDTIIAGRDVVAADSYAAGFFGMKPESISYIKAGSDMGIGRSDLANLKIEEITVGG